MVSPLRLFKRGMIYNSEDEDPFPDYLPRDEAEATYTDEEGTLQPYKPSKHTCVHSVLRFILIIDLYRWTSAQGFALNVP